MRMIDIFPNRYVLRRTCRRNISIDLCNLFDRDKKSYKYRKPTYVSSKNLGLIKFFNNQNKHLQHIVLKKYKMDIKLSSYPLDTFKSGCLLLWIMAKLTINGGMFSILTLCGSKRFPHTSIKWY